MTERSIIHLNVADFAVAVERVVDLRLRRRPVIIAPEGAARAAVYDMSDEAYQQGVRKGMSLRRALRYCKDAAVLPPHPDRYERAMTQFFKHVSPYSPLIEVTDHKGHLFIDATGTQRLFGPPPDVAWRIRKTVRADMGFDPIWSVASNKLVAKVATRLVKPTGEYIVRTGDEAAFLKPLPLYLIPGIEPGDFMRLGEFNLICAGQVADLSSEQLNVVFGNRGHRLYNAVRGIDSSPVVTIENQQPPVRVAHEFGNDTNDVAKVTGTLYQLTEQAAAKLRRRQLAAKRIRVILGYSDGRRTVRQVTANPPTANDFHLFAVANRALTRVWTRRVRLRHLHLVCDRLTRPPAQMKLFFEYTQAKNAEENLVTALDAIRNRFGYSAVRVGRTL